MQDTTATLSAATGLAPLGARLAVPVLVRLAVRRSGRTWDVLVASAASLLQQAPAVAAAAGGEA